MTEENPYTSRFHRLKTVFASGHKLAIPESWVDGRTPKGHAWVGDGSGRYELQIAVGETVVEGGGEAMLEAISGRIADRLQAFGAGGQIGDSKIGRINDCMQIEVVADDPRIPTARTYSWIRLMPYGSTLLELGFHLIVLRELWEREETEDLIELFAAQVRNISIEEEPAPAIGQLRVVRPYGFLTFRIPVQWRDVWDAEAHMWFCGQDEPDKITLWTIYTVFQSGDVDEWARQMMDKLAQDHDVTWRSQIRPNRRHGYHTFSKMGELGYPVRFHRWIVLDWKDETVLLIQSP